MEKMDEFDEEKEEDIFRVILSQTVSTSSHEEAQVGKFVWAKIVGLPWWPGKVEE